MKNFSRLFKEAERLQPPPGMWSTIEVRTGLRWGGKSPGLSPLYRAAAAAALAAGLWAGWLLLPGPRAPGGMAAAETAPVDEELMGWHADLGELDLENEDVTGTDLLLNEDAASMANGEEGEVL